MFVEIARLIDYMHCSLVCVYVHNILHVLVCSWFIVCAMLVLLIVVVDACKLVDCFLCTVIECCV